MIIGDLNGLSPLVGANTDLERVPDISDLLDPEAYSYAFNVEIGLAGSRLGNLHLVSRRSLGSLGSAYPRARCASGYQLQRGG